MRLENKKAVVTGAGQGIGRAIALRLAREGADVAVLDMNEATVPEVVKEIETLGRKAVGRILDVGDPEATSAVFKEITAELGGLDILVNNAGITRDNLIVRMSPDDWDLVLRVNLKGAFNCIRAAARTMMAQRSGRIVNVSSVIGITGNVGQANYSASKAGLIGLTKSAAKELGARGITVNAVAPGYIETPMTASLPDSVRETFASKIALGRLGKPEDVANVVAFLVSDDGDYLTGQTICIDGGMVW
jgi:3-oxoacyl-[acyl-carrier protein] reductase